MTFKIKTEVETNQEIKLPFFVMGICHAYKIIDETTCIQICHGLPDDLSIKHCMPSLALSFKQKEQGLRDRELSGEELTEDEINKKYIDKECTEREFNEIYRSVQKQFNLIVDIGIVEESQIKGIKEAIEFIDPSHRDNISTMQYKVAEEICHNANIELESILQPC